METISFRFTKTYVLFTIKEIGIKSYSIRCGRNKWFKKGNLKPSAHSLFSRRRIDFDSITAAAAGWEKTNTLKISMRFIETCHGDYLTCIFNDGQLTIQTLFSVQRAENKPDSRADLTAVLDAKI